MLLAWPLMALMLRGSAGSIFAGQVGLAVLVGANGAVLPATMAELAPWRVRCTVLGRLQHRARHPRRDHADGDGLAGRAERGPLAPAVYLALAAAVTFTASLLLPHTAPHRLTTEFQATRLR